MYIRQVQDFLAKEHFKNKIPKYMECNVKTMQLLEHCHNFYFSHCLLHTKTLFGIKISINDKLDPMVIKFVYSNDEFAHVDGMTENVIKYKLFNLNQEMKCFSFSVAMDKLLNGKQVSRKSWNVNSQQFSILFVRDGIIKENVLGCIQDYAPIQSDLMALDWYEI